MIPASYLFKDIYNQTWLDANVDAVTESRRSPHKGYPIWIKLRHALASLSLPKAEPRPHGTLVHE